MKRTMQYSTAAFAAAAALAFAGSAPAQSKAESIPIGAVLSVTGPLAVVGLPERDGILLAQKVINKRGGVKGQPIELIIEDDATSPDTAITKVNTLVFGKKVKALIGASGIASSVAIGGITAKQDLPQVTFTGLGPAVERQRTCVFHLTPAQELNARSLLEYAVHQLKAKTVGILYDSGYGQTVYNSLKQLDKEYGVKIVAAEKFDIGATDVTTQAIKVRTAEPDAVLIATTNATAFRNARQVKITAPIIATHPSAPYDVVHAMGDASSNVVFADFLVAEEPLPHQVEFVQAFQKEYHRLPKNFEAAGYDSLMAIAKGLEQVGTSATNQQLCTALRQPYQGQMTQYDFRADDMGGLKTSSFVYSEFKNGKFTRLPFKAGQ